MNDLIVNIERKTRKVELEQLYLGNDHENLQENLVFKFDDEFVNGQARLEYKINDIKNYLILTKVGETYQIPVKNVITINQEETKGKIEFQLVVTEGTDEEEIPVFKSNIFYLRCRPSINAVTEAPEGYDLWIEQANVILNEMDNIDIDIQTVGDNTEVVITRKDGTTKEAIVSGGGGASTYAQLPDKPSINGNTLEGNKTSSQLGLQPAGSYVEDNNYVHTDNNYTTTEKNKLAGLSNYDDTEVRGLISNKVDKVTGKGLSTNDYTTEEKQKLAGIDLSTKQDTLVSGTNIKTINNTSLLGSGNITIQGGSGSPEVHIGDDAPTGDEVIWIDTDEADIALADLADDSTHRLVTDTEKSTWNGKQDALVSGTNIKTINNQSLLGSGNITIQGGGGTSDYDELNNRPQINNVTLTGNKSLNDLGIVNFSGDYTDLTNKPTIPTDTSDLTNGAGFITGISSSDVTTALGYTPYNSSNPNGYTSNTGTITGITMNGASKGTSGVVDLGTVITSHQDIKTINSTSLVGTGNVTVQETLVSGTNIKTINNQSLLGSGNISISGGGGSATDVQINGTSIVSNDVANIITETAYNASSNKIATIADITSTGVNVIVGSTAPTSSTVAKVGDFYIMDTVPSYIYQCIYADNDPQSPYYSWEELLTPDTQIDIEVNGNSIVSGGVANLVTATAYDATTNKIATESDLFSGDYDDLTDKPKINNITISGNKTPQMYGIQPAGNYATNATITTNQVNTTYSFTLNNNTEYRNTLDMTSITLSLPSTIDTDYCSWLVFPSGSTATSLTYPNTILWSGDDVSNNAFVPVSDKTYNVCFWYDSLNVNAVVRGV